MRIPPPAIISLCIGCLVCAVGAGIMLDRAKERDPLSPELELSIPEFSLIDQDGTPVDQSILDGRFTLAGFIFTNCPGLCPMMTTVMAEAQQRLADTPLRFVSFGLDAARDTPEAMRAFGERFGADFRTWTFATGNSEESRRIIRDGLKLVVEDEDDNQVLTAGGGTMANILHPTRLVLIGPDRRVLGFYSVSESSELDRLEADVRAWAASR